MEKEIKENEMYNTAEAMDFLQISESTIKRWLKKGILKANKAGGRYRIWGKDILRLISPEFEQKSIKIYLKAKKQAVGVINKW